MPKSKIQKQQEARERKARNVPRYYTELAQAQTEYHFNLTHFGEAEAHKQLDAAQARFNRLMKEVTPK